MNKIILATCIQVIFCVSRQAWLRVVQSPVNSYPSMIWWGKWCHSWTHVRPMNSSWTNCMVHISFTKLLQISQSHFLSSWTNCMVQISFTNSTNVSIPLSTHKTSFLGGQVSIWNEVIKSEDVSEQLKVFSCYSPDGRRRSCVGVGKSF